MSLDELRAEINELNKELLSLFKRRMAISQKIAEEKTKTGKAIYDAQREEEILDMVSADAGEDMALYARQFFQNIFHLSRHYQMEQLHCIPTNPNDSKGEVITSSPPTLFGLLGKTLGHSYSPRIHHALGNTDYTLFERNPEELESFFADTTLQGLNITIPYKIQALHACQSISDIAARIGCVNTMVRQSDGSWYGHNTDYDGFLYMLQRAHIDVTNKHCLILGDGATSTTVHVALENLQVASITHVSRHQFPTYSDLATFQEKTQIIINTTPIGMYPNNPTSLIDISNFPNLTGVADVVYNPHRTAILLQAESLGLPYSDGLPMLIAQAVSAANLFQNKTHDPDCIERILTDIRQELENIILIGMPGVGKTTVGMELAKELGHTFCDADIIFAEQVGMSSGDYIVQHGEEAFRKKESEILNQLGSQTGLIIATGGGCVTVPDNYLYLRQNGRIYQLIRPVAQLATTGRPLSQGGMERLIELEQIRTPLYEAFAQCKVENQTVAIAVSAIKEDFYAHISD